MNDFQKMTAKYNISISTAKTTTTSVDKKSCCSRRWCRL